MSFEAWVAVASFLGVVGLLLWGRAPTRLMTRRRGRLPRQLELEEITPHEIPSDAQAPLSFLAARLKELGFEPAGPPTRVPPLQRYGHRVAVVPFVHEDEGAYFLMAIEAGLHPKSQLVLHIISPFEDGRRVETSTLGVLEQLRSASNVDSRVVLDAESVDEIWSRHRLALTRHRRELRAPVPADGWRHVAQEAYLAWVQSAVRAQRLQLDPKSEMYRVRSRPRSVW